MSGEHKNGKDARDKKFEKYAQSWKNIASYQSEIGYRCVHKITPEVILFDPPKDTYIQSFPGGGIWIVTAKPGSSLIQRLRETASTGSYEKLSELINSSRKAMLNPTQQEEKEFKSIHEIPVLAELSYGPKMIAQGLFLVPNTDVLFTFVPYNGGNLLANRFTFSQYVWIGSSSRLDCLILIRAPILTELEKSILEKVPSDVSEANLGNADNPAYNGFFWATVAEAVATWALGKVLDATWDAAKCALAGDPHNGRHRATATNGTAAQLQLDDATIVGVEANNGGSLANYYEARSSVEELKELDVHSAAVELLNLRSHLIYKRKQEGLSLPF